MPSVTWRSGFVALDQLPSSLPVVEPATADETPQGWAWLPFHFAHSAIVVTAAHCEEHDGAWNLTLGEGHGVVRGSAAYLAAAEALRALAAPASSFVRLVVVTGLPSFGPGAAVAPAVAAAELPAVVPAPVQTEPAAPTEAQPETLDGAATGYLEDELRAIVASVATSRQQRLALRHWGWSGEERITLKALGQETDGVTRERVRQIVQEVEVQLSGLPAVSTPVLDSALELIRDSLPIAAKAIPDLLREAGLSRATFELKALQRACAIFEKPEPFSVKDVRGMEILLPLDESGDKTQAARDAEELVITELRIAQSAVRENGATRVRDVLEHVEKKLGTTVDEKQLAGLLRARTDFQWVDEDGGWFWLTEAGKNGVVTRVRKILSVSGCATIHELHEGIARDVRMGTFTLPEHLLEALCGQMRGVEVVTRGEVTIVSAEEALDPTKELMGEELAMFNVLREHGPVLESARFRELCDGTGVSRESFYNRSRYSPIFAEDDRMFRLRGGDQDVTER